MQSADSYKLKGMRERLVAMLAAKGIRDERVLATMRQLPRHAFVESAFAEKAYQDIPLPIGHEQTISQPYTVAYMTEQLALNFSGGRHPRVLEVGTGSGYQAAVLAAMGVEVYSIERNRPLLLTARAVLATLGLEVHLKVGDGTLGWPAQQPFDGIIVTAGGPHLPEPLKAQVAIGGRLVCPIGSREGQTLIVLHRSSETEFTETRHPEFRFVPLIGAEGWSG